jgi:hypothetical protein
MGDYTLNISEVQVLVNYPADADGFYWHHRILLCRVEGSTWLTLTPDHEIVRHDLAGIPHRILDRCAPFPEDIIDEIYAHDEIGKASLNAFKRQANTMAVILGEETLPESESYTWVIAEPDREDFGEEVDRMILHNPATGLAFSTKGVVQIHGEEVYVERVQAKDLPDWRKRRMLGQADVRLLGDHKDSSGRRRLELPLAVSLMKQHEEDGFPISGTRASKELHEAVASGAGNFVSYHAEWMRLSGVSRRSSSAIVHQSLCEILRLAHFYDQVDSSSLASLEHVARWLIRVELAVERNPQQPNYEGLDILTGTSVSSDGRATTTKFVEWISNRMKDRANIWRQERLFKQERQNQKGRGQPSTEDNSEDEDPNQSNSKRKKKKGKGAAAASGAAEAK